MKNLNTLLQEFSAIETRVNQLSERIEIDFSPKNSIEQQIEHIEQCQNQLAQLSLEIQAIIDASKGKDKGSFIQDVAIAIGSSLGGATAAGARQARRNLKQDKEGLKKFFLDASYCKKVIETNILRGDKLKRVARLALGDRNLLLYLSKEQSKKDMLSKYSNTIFSASLVFGLVAFILFIIFAYRREVILSVIAISCTALAFLVIRMLLNASFEVNKNWQSIITKLANESRD